MSDEASDTGLENLTQTLLNIAELTELRRLLGAKILYGDGVADDTEALQALMNGKQVFDKDGNELLVEAGFVRVPSGRYNLSDTLCLGSTPVIMDSVSLTYTRDRPQGLIVEGTGHSIDNCDIRFSNGDTSAANEQSITEHQYVVYGNDA